MAAYTLIVASMSRSPKSEASKRPLRRQKKNNTLSISGENTLRDLGWLTERVIDHSDLVTQKVNIFLELAPPDTFWRFEVLI